jgi:histone deacetylase 1/2
LVFQYYAPDFELDVRPSNMENSNSFEYLEKIKAIIIDNLRHTIPAPSVQMQDVPRQGFGVMTDEEEAELNDLDEDENPDVRMTERRWEQTVQNEAEYEDSDDEEQEAAHGKTKPRAAKKGQFSDRKKDAPAEAESGNATPAANGKDADAPNAEPHEDADVTLDKPSEEEETTEKDAPAPVTTDKDGDVDMDNADAADVPDIKKEETDAEPAPEAVDKPASRQATPAASTNGATEDDAKAKASTEKEATPVATEKPAEDDAQEGSKMDVDKPAETNGSDDK